MPQQLNADQQNDAQQAEEAEKSHATHRRSFTVRHGTIGFVRSTCIPANSYEHLPRLSICEERIPVLQS